MKKYIFLALALALLAIGVVFVSATVSNEEPVQIEQKEFAQCGADSCGANSCGGTCGGNCGVSSCGCGK